MTRLLTTREVADALGVSSATVLRRWRAGELPGFRIASNCLRFDETEINSWLQERRGDAYSPRPAAQERAREAAHTDEREDPPA